MTRAAGKKMRHRLSMIGLGVLLIAGLGFLFSGMPRFYHLTKQPRMNAQDQAETPSISPAGMNDPHRAINAEIKKRFEEAAAMLHTRRYDHAVAALHRVLELNPRLPEAHVNMGYALLGLEQFGAAADFFLSAIDLRPSQANAYYGLAVAHENLGELPQAMGAMSSYLHLAPPEARHRRKAQAALWEWEARMNRQRGRGPAVGDKARNEAQKAGRGGQSGQRSSG